MESGITQYYRQNDILFSYSSLDNSCLYYIRKRDICQTELYHDIVFVHGVSTVFKQRKWLLDFAYAILFLLSIDLVRVGRWYV